MEDREDLAMLVTDFIQMVKEEIEQKEVEYTIDAALHNAGAKRRDRDEEYAR
jgi:hypothetical protein